MNISKQNFAKIESSRHVISCLKMVDIDPQCLELTFTENIG